MFNAFRIFVWRASVLGKVMMFWFAILYFNRQMRDKADRALSTVSPPFSVVPSEARKAISIWRVTFNANIEINTCPIVLALFLRKIGREEHQFPIPVSTKSFLSTGPFLIGG